MELKTLAVLIACFIGIMFALAILPEMGSTVNEMTEFQNTTNETVSIAAARVTGLPGEVNSSINITLAQAPTGWKITDCPISMLTIINSTGGSLTGNTDGTGDYVPLDLNRGIIQYNNTGNVNNTASNNTFATYFYCADGYVTGSTRTIVLLIMTFAALAILAIAIWAAWKNKSW